MPTTVRTLLGKQATAEAIRRGLEACAKSPTSDVFIFFFSGRALLNWTDQEGADGARRQCELVGSDWDGRGKGLLPLAELAKLVSEVQAGLRVVVIDA